jgi:toxin ParE1/3/4
MHLWPVGKYLILYRAAADGIEVVRVVHGARDLERVAF